MTRFCLKPLTLTTWIALGVISQINIAQAADDSLIGNATNQTLIQTQDARNQALLEQLVPNPSVVADMGNRSLQHHHSNSRTTNIR
ncbi:hypothetical protein [Moraxella oculi]|uniref:Uncharacterized protein n=1 Tax=Moraxella oculi TaxID=2940516 RepID=A0ABW8UC64_9GAMM